MSTLSVVRGGAIGLAAIATPTAVLLIAIGYTWSSTLSGLLPYVALLCVALAAIAWQTRACIRIAHFPPRVAIALTTFPFIFITLATVPLATGGAIYPLLFWAVQLAVAMFVARFAARRAIQ